MAQSSRVHRQGWSLPTMTPDESELLDSPARSAGLSFIEQLSALSEGCSCENPSTPYLLGLNHKTRRALVSRASCNQWSCEACAGAQRARWAKRIFEGVEHYQSAGVRDWSFITITSHRALKTFDQTVFVFPSAWSKLSSRMRRKFKGLRYVLVPEQHKDGRLHFHAIVGAAVSKRWLSDNAAACGFGWRADAGPLRSPALCAWYVSKYMTKDFGQIPFPKGFRRVRTSQEWPDIAQPDIGDPSVTWRAVGAVENASLMLVRWLHQGYTPIWAQTGMRIRP